MVEEKILKTVEKYNLIDDNDCIVVAVSGGPDSMCLLNSLRNLQCKLRIGKLVVAHVNHMLRKEANEETEYVKKYCEDRNIEFYAKYVNIKDVSRDTKTSEETAGRIERYKFFEEISEKVGAQKIAIAHNYNDNAETILMHLLRGSGISGMSGIKPYRDGKYIRPIIECNRNEIELYCSEKGLKPKFDKSNDNNEFTRNKIRNLLIPYLKKEFNPNVIETLNRLSKVVLEEERYMEKVTNKEYVNTLKEDKSYNRIVLDLKMFNNLDNAIKSRIILKITKKLFGTSNGIEKIHIDDIIRLCGNNIGNKFLMPNKEMKVYVKKGEVSFERI